MHGLDLALSAFDSLGHHARLNRHVVGRAGFFHHVADGIHAIAAEQTHEVVFEREVELREARVARAAGAATQLVVDASALVALGADNGQATRTAHLFLLALARFLRLGERRIAIGLRRNLQLVLAFLHLGLGGCFGVKAALTQHVVGEHLGVAAEQNVGTAASHVRRDGHSAQAARLRDDMRLALVVLRVQGLVGNAALVEQTRELLGAFKRNGANQARLAGRMALLHVIGHGLIFRLDSAVHQVVFVFTNDGLVRRNGHDGQLVDLTELGIFGHGGTRHARELVVETEVVLQCDGREGLVLFANANVFLRLHRLMQAFRPATALHNAARVFVDDFHLAAHYDIIDIAMEHEVGLQGLLQVVRKLARRVVVDIVDAQAGLDFRQASLSREDGLFRLIELIVFVAN